MRRFRFRASAWFLLFLLFIAGTGCPHRSPVWSPDGERIVLLAGSEGEEVDKAASQLWLVAVEGGKAKRLKAPEEGLRYLAAAWVEKDAFVVFSGKWHDGYIDAGTEKVWRVEEDGERWKALSFPPPAEARAIFQPPVVVGVGEKRALVYPSGEEAVAIASLRDEKETETMEPAELVGPGPGNGFLIYRPEPSGTGGMEVVACGADRKVLWSRRFSQLRDEIAAKLQKKPVDIVFNDTSTSHLPFGAGAGNAAAAGGLGLTLIFKDVGWKDGISGYYVELEAGTGKVRSAVHGLGLTGKPAAAGALWAVTAPDPKHGIPVQLQTFDLKTQKPLQVKALEGIKKEGVHGYAFDPLGKRFALSLNGPVPILRLFTREDFDKPREIRLE
jgi:hypothetical protein